MPSKNTALKISIREEVPEAMKAPDAYCKTLVQERGGMIFKGIRQDREIISEENIQTILTTSLQ